MNRATLTLLALLLICALSLVAAQQKARKLFIAIERAQMEERRLNQEALRLEYDQRTLSKSARIQDSARNQLRMLPITPDRTLYLKDAQ
ncbi:cell division protein FtsL [Polynucleobacter sp. IMCC30063]|jgi:cell division protein FtsL|uniref:cell division protein FtsL n=1 Tax=unclassified Polynucleobacter TaxID=2640945 RepID=UPI001F31F559|nr:MULTISPECIES: cell division protein FtsL [unclassified Polynucleobacter]MCE7505039.1 cell division protein FtsL [Polynucleobacter sp. IMCC30063]MCE7526169.1 cell division protein FtsL [Polynucleobacter sp. IMCC 30228]MCE7528476.1 cell division protein FtsL [Polynucleobacter sp. IMCC 29146]